MEITKGLLKQKFEEYNKLYFNNELPMCTFSYNYMRYAQHQSLTQSHHILKKQSPFILVSVSNS